MDLKFKIRRFFRNFSIENLMTYVAATMAIIFVGDLFTDYQLSSWLSFNRDAILDGQIWRIFTFLVMPQTNEIVWIAVSVYFYYLIGQDVENSWGSHNLTLYFLTGSALLIAVGFATGYSHSHYLYFSLFLVHAHLHPRDVIRLFMLIPLEAKWIAVIDAVYMLYKFFQAFQLYLLGYVQIALGIQLSVLAAFATFFIFFGKEYFSRLSNKWKHRNFFAEMRRNNIQVNHRDKDDDHE